VQQCVHQRALAGFRIGGIPEASQFHEAASSLTEAAHQIETRVDDTPGQIAAKRSQDHGLDVRAPRGSHAERARAR